MPLNENRPSVRVGVWVKVRVSFRVGVQPDPKENSPPVRDRVWVRVRFGAAGQISLGTIVLELF